MDRVTINNTVVDILQAKKIISNKHEIDFEAPLQETYGLDSINFIEIIISLEEIYNFEFDDSNLDMKKFNNINSIIDTVYSQLNKLKT